MRHLVHLDEIETHSHSCTSKITYRYGVGQYNTYHSVLQAAWKDVLNEKSDTNWALYGYDGSSNILKLVATGNYAHQYYF